LQQADERPDIRFGAHHQDRVGVQVSPLGCEGMICWEARVRKSVDALVRCQRIRVESASPARLSWPGRVFYEALRNRMGLSDHMKIDRATCAGTERAP
jgi:hypothetical protein